MAKVIKQRFDPAVPLERLKPHPRNPRQGDVGAIGEMIEENGFYGAVLVQESTGFILAGKHRWQAGGQHGLKTLPVFWVNVDDEQALRIVLADNRASDLASYDSAELADLLKEVSATAGGWKGTGWDGDALDDLLRDLEPQGMAGETDPDEEPPRPASARTRRGDLWLLGGHKLLCGDATSPHDYEALLGLQEADMIWTDPPYNVAVHGGTHDARDKKNYQQGPEMENDQLSDAKYAQLLATSFRAMFERLRPGGAAYVCHADRATPLVWSTYQQAGFTASQMLIWAKQNFVFGRSDYHFQHEPILYGWRPGAPHRFHGEPNQSTLWQIDRPMRSDMEHPTQKPVELVQVAIVNSSRDGEVVLDPFAGGGSTLIACEQLDRKARLIEIDPLYCDVVCKRFEAFTGTKPVLARTGKPVGFA